ncbi:HIT family protein [Candidatus Woesearchaeota archaeon]|nr:HIT family protein [Candidatus Woesearchaeota archaeon]
MRCIFCDFVSGKRKRHKNRFPFKKLHETRNVVAFLSVDFPATENGHTIVIPKRHFKLLESVPDGILAELIGEIKLISKVLRRSNEGTNVLLNNGRCAGQKVPHVHFHVIPRNPRDHIDVEHFRRKKMSLVDFERLHKELRKRFVS